MVDLNLGPFNFVSGLDVKAGHSCSVTAHMFVEAYCSERGAEHSIPQAGNHRILAVGASGSVPALSV
jgi:hypothetical protein